MRYLAFDLETTGLDTTTCEIIEIGFALYDMNLGKMPIITRDFICLTKEPITSEIEGITGISPELQELVGVPLHEALVEFIQILDKYEVTHLVAHNGLDYDIPVISRAFQIEGLNVKLPPCIDTKIDLPFTRPFKSTSLVYLNAEHGFLNPFPHRALFDAMSCAKLLNMYPVEIVAQLSTSPMVTAVAQVTYDERDLARQAGYSWNAERKQWQKKLRKVLLEQERKLRKFQVKEISST